MSGFLVRFFSTNRNEIVNNEIDGVVRQSLFLSSEIKDVEVSHVRAYTKVESEIVKNPNNEYIDFPSKSLEFSIKTKMKPFSKLAEIEDLENFFSRKYLYIATRWNGQPSNVYPKALPSSSNHALRIAIEEIGVENDEGFLSITIKGKAKKW